MCMSKDAKVAVIMENISDFSVMKNSISIINKFEIEYQVFVFSPFENPDKVVEFAKNVEQNGFDIVIVGESKANQLASMVAGFAPIPVICVPNNSTNLETIQTPIGVPIANVGINSPENAAYLAIQMLSIAYHELRHKIIDFKEELQHAKNEENKEIKQMNKNILPQL